ncbi:MAG TPA: helix-turn-helix transcriptional regulator [Longimicrobiales bacterium]|nr:helix-turn-helix transcriptional regulator [Longimicrobiales bacterium]
METVPSQPQETASQLAPLEARCVHRAIERDGLHAFEASYAPQSSLPLHSHADPFFTYVVRGGFTEHGPAGMRECQRGSVIFYAADATHANAVSRRGTTSLNISVAPFYWEELVEGGRRSASITGPILRGDVERAALLVWREFHHNDDSSNIALSEAIAALCAFVRSDSYRRELPARKLELAAEYIAERPVPAPTLSDVASTIDVHPMHLARLFRRRFGYSMGEFMRRRRIEWALGELADGELTIGAIAVRAGFADHAHFTRTFVRLVGCTPTWYRGHTKGFVPPTL